LPTVREPGGLRKALQSEHAQAAATPKSERRWRMLFQALFFDTPVPLRVGTSPSF
jgi:hypothetical protein